MNGNIIKGIFLNFQVCGPLTISEVIQDGNSNFYRLFIDWVLTVDHFDPPAKRGISLEPVQADTYQQLVFVEQRIGEVIEIGQVAREM